MAFFIPQFYSNYTFPSTDNFYEFPTPVAVAAAGNRGGSVIESAFMWGGGHDQYLQDDYNYNYNLMIPLLDNMNIGALDHHSLLPDCDTIMPSSCANWMSSSLDDQLVMPELFSNSKTGSYGIGEECYGFVDDIKPTTTYLATTARENWGIPFQSNEMVAVEEPNSNVKVGRYSEQERKERILRYLKKRNKRNFNKTIKYACRKTLADRRVRVRGRFASNKNELYEEEMFMKKNDNPHTKEDFFCTDAIHQFKNDEEEWVQEAMANLVYLCHA
ncbi:Zinc finger protein CONSTANS-LIKE 3 [Quillaja saponaria]|uniref:Zinc finger protein CONSTANS-LIKE 3 n=1 Tax=Quillaja saponaria TaxID=32244 RepID=A0AAD7PB30_QUISA|nr:Zinc finger protein CONSTANS-LIKE 3 [Quillaja saponaria]